LKDVGTSVQRVRANAGHLLIVLTKESSARTSELHKAVQDALKEQAEVRSRVQELDIEIKDMDEVTTKEEVVEVLQRELGANSGVTLAAIRSLRSSYGKTKTAVVKLLVPAAKKFLELRSIRVGWTYCRVRESVRPLKCFRCWNFGHLFRNCKSEEDRSRCCIRCGEKGHKVATCNNDTRCVLCEAKDDKEAANHIAGSSKCPTYARALQTTAKRQK